MCMQKYQCNHYTVMSQYLIWSFFINPGDRVFPKTGNNSVDIGFTPVYLDKTSTLAKCGRERPLCAPLHRAAQSSIHLSLQGKIHTYKHLWYRRTMTLPMWGSLSAGGSEVSRWLGDIKAFVTYICNIVVALAIRTYSCFSFFGGDGPEMNWREMCAFMHH